MLPCSAVGLPSDQPLFLFGSQFPHLSNEINAVPTLLVVVSVTKRGELAIRKVRKEGWGDASEASGPKGERSASFCVGFSPCRGDCPPLPPCLAWCTMSVLCSAVDRTIMWIFYANSRF